jgi:hypothetical protein
MSVTAFAGDLSKYRNFELGSDVVTVVKQAAEDPSQAKVIHSRPALIQDFEWRPQPLGAPQTESVKEILFSFFDGELFRIQVDYDRYQTEGLTAADFVDALAQTYGPAIKPTAPAKVAPSNYGEQEEVVAQWENSQYRFDLVRLSYGPTFRLVGVLKRLEQPVQTATVEAKRLDDQEAPQRDAARRASEEEAVKTNLEKARLANKPKFRP